MLKIKNYKFGFDIWGIVLLLIIMIPNFIWFGVSAPNDILRNESVTPQLDMIAAVFQVVMIIFLALITNKQCNKPMNKKWLIAITAAIVFYFAAWIFYYLGIVNAVIILDLCIAPCIAFILFSIARKNIASLISAVVFMVCHITYGIINFIV